MDREFNDSFRMRFPRIIFVDADGCDLHVSGDIISGDMIVLIPESDKIHTVLSEYVIEHDTHDEIGRQADIGRFPVRTHMIVLGVRKPRWDIKATPEYEENQAGYPWLNDGWYVEQEKKKLEDMKVFFAEHQRVVYLLVPKPYPRIVLVCL